MKRKPFLTLLVPYLMAVVSCQQPTGPGSGPTTPEDPPQNTAPVIESIDYSPQTLITNQDITLLANYHDNESPVEDLTVSYETTGDGQFDDTSVVQYATGGDKTVEVKVTDPEGLETIESLVLSVVDKDPDTTAPDSAALTLETKVNPGDVNYAFQWPADDDSQTAEIVSGIKQATVYASAIGNLSEGELSSYATLVDTLTAQTAGTQESSPATLASGNSDYTFYLLIEDWSGNTSLSQGSVRSGGPEQLGHIIYGTVAGFTSADSVELYNVKEGMANELVATLPTDDSGVYGTAVQYIPNDTPLLISPVGQSSNQSVTYQNGAMTEHNF